MFGLCLKIFLGRFVEVSLSTLNTLYVVKGKKLMATIVGFIDVLIWFLIVKEALNNPGNSIWIALSYAGGYALGIALGSTIGGKIITGTTQIQVITKNIDNAVTDAIRDGGYGASIIRCHGLHDEERSYMIYAQVDNKKVGAFKKLINKVDSHAFVTITESKEILNGYFGDK
ncbi:MAG: DUF2179 domain-containing protein [Bacilli bacterium]|nr:DUF2179 domain-containing protein [Bacilli bacterium]